MCHDSKRIFFVVVLVFLGVAGALPYKMLVTVRDNTGTKLRCKNLFASEKNNSFIEKAEFCATDTTYLFKSLPDHPIYINTIIDNDTEDLWMGEQNEPQDTLCIDLPIDYTTVQLSEVVVNPDPRLITDDRTIYRPSARQKKIAHDASGLLLSMDIPELKINPVSKSVTTLAGDGISYFIDYVPASSAQLENLRTEDVKSVEFFESPSNPVFRGERNVVNFILVKYECGGYTKLLASQYFVTPLTNYGASTRLSFKNLTFDVGINGKYSKLTHNKSFTEKTFHLSDKDLKWEETRDFDATSGDSEAAYVMINYDTKSFNMTHTIGLRHSGDRIKSLSDIRFDNPPLSVESATLSQNSKSLCPYWVANFQFLFPHGWSLTVDPTFSYADNTYKYDYALSEDPILNDVNEHTFDINLKVNGTKSFGKGHRLNLGLFANNQSYRINYLGNLPAKINSRETEFNFSPSLSLNLGKIGLYLSGGIGALNSKINTEHQTDLLLRYFVSGNYRIDSRNRLTASTQLNYVVIPMSQRSPNLILLNGLEAKQGNPALKPTVYSRQNISYLCYPSRWLSLSAFCRFDRYARAVALTVITHDSSDKNLTLISSNENSGFQNILTTGVGGNLSLLSDKLSIGFNASYSCMRRHGLQMMKDDFITFSAYANYYLGNFYLQPFYSYSANSYSNVAVTKHPSSYQIVLGWSNGNLNVSAGARNFFRSSWENTTTVIDSGNYMSVLTDFGGMSHRGFTLTLSYSFSYGKKIGQKDTKIPSNNIESGIMK